MAQSLNIAGGGGSHRPHDLPVAISAYTPSLRIPADFNAPPLHRCTHLRSHPGDHIKVFLNRISHPGHRAYAAPKIA